MKVNIYDTNGNDWGGYGESRNVEEVEIYIPATIVGLANEHGIQITTHGTPVIREQFSGSLSHDGALFTLVIREEGK